MASDNLYRSTIKMSQNHSYISTTYHESGHVVIGLLMYMRVSNVFVVKDRLISGATHYEVIEQEQSKNIDISEYLAKSDIFLSYAGYIAEKKLYKDITGSNVFPKVLKNGIEQDLSQAHTIIISNNMAPPGKKRYQFKKRMMNKTAGILEKHWDVVKIVAHELFENKKLSYEELKKVICRKTHNKKFWKKQFAYIQKFNKNKQLDAKDIKLLINSTL